MILDINIHDTLAEFDYKKISWSKLSQFDDCPLSWFAINFARFTEAEATSQENTRALPGTLVQKLTEVFINERVYMRPEMVELGDLYKWFRHNLWALWEVYVFPWDQQFQIKNPRTYFRTKAGQARLEQIHEKFNLEKSFSGFKPQFINMEFFNKEMGSKDQLLEKIDKLFPKILNTWATQEMDLDKILSEVFVRAHIYGDIWISGQLDFIYNKYGLVTPFNDIHSLADNYIIIDGKYNISRYNKEEQLFFYAAMLYFAHRRIPSAVSLMNWSTGTIKNYKFSLDYITVLKNKIAKMVEISERLHTYLQELAARNQEVVNICELNPIMAQPSQSNCTFCHIRKNCTAACEAGTNTNELLEGIIQKREVKAHIESLKLDPDKSVHNIDL